MKRKQFVILIFVLAMSVGYALSQSKPISDVTFIKIKKGRELEALYFYENNWKVFRKVALEKGYIKSFRFLKTRADSLADFDLILITEYNDSTQYKAQEINFRPIMKQLSPDGPKLLNGLKPKDFVTILFNKVTSSE